MVLCADEIIQGFLQKNYDIVKRTDKRWNMFKYWIILENQNMCIKADGYWYCKCIKNNRGIENPRSMSQCSIWKFNMEFNEPFERCAQSYLRDKPEESNKLLKIVMKKQMEILLLYPKMEEVLNKEYQQKKSYQGKYCNPMDIYGPYYIESTVHSKYLEIFNLFGRNNNFERF